MPTQAAIRQALQDAVVRRRTGACRRSARVLRALAVAVATLWAAVAHAQVAVNPHVVSFIPSADHDGLNGAGQQIVASYDLEFYEVGASRPIVVLELGKPDPASDATITLDFTERLGSRRVVGVLLEARVVAIGPDGRAASAPSNMFFFTDGPLTLRAVELPVVRLASPANGARFTAPARIGVSVALLATARSPSASPARDRTANNDRMIMRVTFYANGKLVGSASSSPYRITWTVAAAGTYSVVAAVVDNRGRLGWSQPVSVTVEGGPGALPTARPRKK